MKVQDLFLYNPYRISKDEQPTNAADYIAMLNEFYAKEVETVKNTTAEQVAADIAREANLDMLKDEPLNFTPFTKEQQEKRMEMSARCHNTIVNMAASVTFNLVHTGEGVHKRTEQNVLSDHSGTPAAQAYNRESERILAEKYTNPKAVLKRYVDAYRQLDEWHCMDFVQKELTDEELVDRQSHFITAMQRILMVENTKSAIADLEGLDHNAPDIKRMEEELDEIVTRYHKNANLFTAMDSRYSRIENPYYAILDPNDPEFKILSAVNNKDMQNACLCNLMKTDERYDGLLNEYVSTDGLYRNQYLTNEVESAVTILNCRGVDTKKIMFRDVTDEGKPRRILTESSSHVDDCVMALHFARFKRVELFDADHPDVKVIINNDSLTRTYHTLNDEPAPAELKLVPPKRPNAFHRLMHWFSRKNYQAEFDAYDLEKNRYDIEMAKRTPGKWTEANPVKKPVEKAAEKAEEVQQEKAPEKQQTLSGADREKNRAQVERETIRSFAEAQKPAENDPLAQAFSQQLKDIAERNPDGPDSVRKFYFKLVNEKNTEMLDRIKESLNKPGNTLESMASTAIQKQENAAHADASAAQKQQNAIQQNAPQQVTGNL